MNFETVLLTPFRKENAAAVLSWIDSSTTLRNWASRIDFPLTDAAVFDQWHADPDVTPFEIAVDGVLAGYGELWCESVEPFAEIARVIVVPEQRGRGIGRLIVDKLAVQVCERGFNEVWTRVVPENISARRCYESADFTPVSNDEQCELDAGQPYSYVWLRRHL